MCTDKEVKTEITLNLRKISGDEAITTGVLVKDENFINKTCSDIAGWIISNFANNAVDDARFVIHTNGTIDVHFVLMFYQNVMFRFVLANRIRRIIRKTENILNKNYGYLITRTTCKTRK